MFTISKLEHDYCARNEIPLPRHSPAERLRLMCAFRPGHYLYHLSCGKTGKSSLYGRFLYHSRDIVDSFYIRRSEICYGCLDIQGGLFFPIEKQQALALEFNWTEHVEAVPPASTARRANLAPPQVAPFERIRQAGRFLQWAEVTTTDCAECGRTCQTVHRSERGKIFCESCYQHLLVQ